MLVSKKYGKKKLGLTVGEIQEGHFYKFGGHRLVRYWTCVPCPAVGQYLALCSFQPCSKLCFKDLQSSDNRPEYFCPIRSPLHRITVVSDSEIVLNLL